MCAFRRKGEKRKRKGRSEEKKKKNVRWAD